MTIQDAFNIVVVIFTVSNLAAMGLELNLREALKTLRNARAIGLVLLWGWGGSDRLEIGDALKGMKNLKADSLQVTTV